MYSALTSSSQHSSRLPTPVGSQVVRPSHPRASVVIVNYNGGADLKRCLRSLREDAGFRDEIIVVDNASTDDSCVDVQRDSPYVTVLRNPTNVGFGRGNNQGAQLAHGQYLAFLNPDTLVSPCWLQALIAALESDPGAGLATSKLLLLAERDLVNTCGNELHFTGLTLCRGMGAQEANFNRTEEVAAVSGAAFAMRRDLFESLGGFDGDFFLYLEDTDLSLRARLAGYRCLVVPSSVVYHDYQLAFGPVKVFCLERNRYLLLLKSFRWRTLLVLLPALLLSELVAWGFLLLSDWRWCTSKLRAYAWILTHLPAVLNSRARTQAIRRRSDRDLLAACTYRLDFAQTGSGRAVSAARLIFNPLFWALYRATMAVVRW